MVLQQARNTPWKVWNEIARRLSYPLARLIFKYNGIPWGRNWRIYGLPIIQKHRGSTITFGPGLSLRSSYASNPGVPNHPVSISTLTEDACLKVGANFGMSGGAIVLVDQITIGDHVYLGVNSYIFDSDFHPLDYRQRQTNPNHGATRPVVIEDNVFIGMNCTIMKGVHLGAGSVIGAGSVVVRSIPPYTIAAGNPARVIKHLD